MSSSIDQAYLSIVIPTFKRAKSLKRTLESIQDQELLNLVVQVVIVINTADDETLKTVEIFKEKQKPPLAFDSIILTEAHVNKARNLGLKKAQYDLVYFVDDDIIFCSKKHLINLINHHKVNPDASAIGGGYTPTLNPSAVEKSYCNISHFLPKKHSDLFGSTPFLLGGNTLYNKSKIGSELYFNEDFHFGGTETELNLRLYNKSHLCLFYDELSVRHESKLTFKAFLKKAYLQGRGRYKIEKNFSKKLLSELQDELLNNKNQFSFIQKFFIECYHFSFHVGFRDEKERETQHHNSVIITLKNIIKTFFQINTEDVLYFSSTQHLSFHQKKIPSLKFNEIYHWSKAHFWWRIRVFFLWKFMSSLVFIFIAFCWYINPFDIQAIKNVMFSLAKALEDKLKKESL